MIRSQLGMLLVIGTLASESCPSTPPKPPSSDAGDAAPSADASTPKDASVILADSSLVIVDAGRVMTPCEKACGNLKALGCQEGLEANCASTCEKTQAARMTNLHPECLAAAATKSAAQACKSVACP